MYDWLGFTIFITLPLQVVILDWIIDGIVDGMKEVKRIWQHERKLKARNATTKNTQLKKLSGLTTTQRNV